MQSMLASQASLMDGDTWLNWGLYPSYSWLCLSLPWCPESPRQLIRHHEDEAARKSLEQIFPSATSEQIRSKIEIFRRLIEETTLSVSDRSLWWQTKQLVTVPANLRALTTACVVMEVNIHVHP